MDARIGYSSTDQFEYGPQNTLLLLASFTGPDRQKNKQRAQKQFQRYDVNKDGVLEKSEVETAVKGLCKEIGMAPPPQSKVDAMFAKCDTNGDGVLSTDEWEVVYRLLMKQVSKLAEEAVEAAKRELEEYAAEREAEAVAERAAREAKQKEMARKVKIRWWGRLSTCLVGAGGANGRLALRRLSPGAPGCMSNLSACSG